MSSAEIIRVHHALHDVVWGVGEHLERVHTNPWEGLSLSGHHVWSGDDLEATTQIVRAAATVFARERIEVDLWFENEELPMIPLGETHPRQLRLIIDPIDGSKAFALWK